MNTPLTSLSLFWLIIAITLHVKGYPIANETFHNALSELINLHYSDSLRADMSIFDLLQRSALMDMTHLVALGELFDYRIAMANFILLEITLAISMSTVINLNNVAEHLMDIITYIFKR